MWNAVQRLLSHLSREWPRYAQIAGFLLGGEQIGAWWIGGHEPNIGAMTFAAGCLMFQRIAGRKP
ncbi:MAG TPA: hypothetical protein VMB51_05185 [Solirubrobacteraceae bacterium]|nr:hypothetical protein [Solirubrobacteraceae bacterium]